MAQRSEKSKTKRKGDKRGGNTRDAGNDTSQSYQPTNVVGPAGYPHTDNKPENTQSDPPQRGWLATVRGLVAPVAVVLGAFGSAYYAWIQNRANVEADPARIEVKLPVNNADEVVIRQYFVNRGNLTAEQLSVHTIAIFVPHAADTSDLILPERWSEGDPIHANNVVPSPPPSVASLPKDGSASTISTAAVGRGPGQLDPNLLFRLYNAADDAEIMALARITYRDAFYVRQTKYSCLIWRPSEPKAVTFCGRWNS